MASIKEISEIDKKAYISALYKNNDTSLNNYWLVSNSICLKITKKHWSIQD